MMLEVRNLTKKFRGLTALSDVSFDVEQGEIVALIGPNGAGKTTCFSVVAGAMSPSAGTVTFDGRRIDGMTPERVAQAGLVRTFQIVRPMRGLSVVENVMIGALLRTSDVEEAESVARAALGKVGLADKAEMVASSLTLPDRKMLELGRAIAAKPRLLLLDEVMAGLRPAESDRIVAVLRALRDEGLTILLIEHVMRVVMSMADRVIVLHHGQMLASGRPEDVVADPLVVESYLGKKARP
jgi:branched-chain amino acid transport system ATP-binding protein